MVALASAITVPIGIGVAVWLVGPAATARSRTWCGSSSSSFTGVPSIVFELFVYIVLIVGTGTSYAGWKGSIALSLLMLPVVVRSAEVILNLVPDGLRDFALALGAPRWRVVGRIVLPDCRAWSPACCSRSPRPQHTTPLLFTAAYTHETTTNLGSFTLTRFLFRSTPT